MLGRIMIGLLWYKNIGLNCCILVIDEYILWMRNGNMGFQWKMVMWGGIRLGLKFQKFIGKICDDISIILLIV